MELTPAMERFIVRCMAKQKGQLPMKTALRLAQLGDGLGESLKRLVK